MDNYFLKKVAKPIIKQKVEVTTSSWDADSQIKYFSQPYGFADSLEWIYNVQVRGRMRPRAFASDFPSINTLEICRVDVKIKLGFIGDIMPIDLTSFKVGQGIKDFFSDVDFFVGNFEGTILNGFEKPVFMSLKHTEKVLSVLSEIFPPYRTILSCANNHAGDFGWKGFYASYNLLQEFGFVAIGRRDEPSVLIDGKINVASGTQWSNQKCRFVARFDEIQLAYVDDAEFNILFPHWGYEMQHRPKPCQRRMAGNLLSRWDMLVGHHSHYPQPFEVSDFGRQRKLIVYSLGDFCFATKRNLDKVGIIIKVDLGPDPFGAWAIGKVQWRFLSMQMLGERDVELTLGD
jgi:hypothetical protein